MAFGTVRGAGFAAVVVLGLTPASLLAQGGGLAKPPPLGAPVPSRPVPPPASLVPPPPAPPGLALRPADAANLPPLAPDQPVRVQLRRGQAAFFRVSPEAGEAYVVTTRRLERNTDTLLRALDAGGETVAEDDDGGEEALASRLEVQPGDGVALIRAGTLGDAGGAFELVLARDTPRATPDYATTPEAAANRPPLVVGEAVPLRLRGGQFAYFRLPEDRTDLSALTRNLARNTDTVLALIGKNGEVLAEDDDGGGSLASMLALGEAPNALLLRAGILGNSTGEFELVLVREGPRAPPDFPTSLDAARARGPLAVGTNLTIRLERRQQAFFALPQGQDLVALTRNLRENADTVLALLDAGGQVILEDDDGGEGLASRVATSDAPRSAAFLRASVLGDSGGTFDLAIEAGEPAPPEDAYARDVAEAASRPPLAVGEAVSLRLRASQSAVFALPREDRELLAMTFGLGRGVDTVLELLDERGNEMAEDDDGGDGLASRLAIQPGAAPSFIRVRLLGDRPGSFSVVVIRRAR
ncbi:hypothetical protein ACE7GA_00615 [Roseomonas sp. CCTCC AB2023176]|uniref:hypothetical protein n=1 Tax=Roseomonas sp. CCTCC AB2023176 TaxID=3342640 RepID=UPI0035D97A37